LWWQRLKLRLRPEQDPNARSMSGAILAASLVIIGLASYVAYLRLRSGQTSEPAQTSVVQTTPAAQQPSTSSSPIAEPRPSQPTLLAKNDRSTARKAPASSLDGETRSGNVIPNLTLREVKKVYIDIRGDAAANQLRSNLVESLRSRGVVVTGADDADAALKIVVSPASTSAQLVNARGTVLWKKTGRLSEIVKDFVSEIKQ